MSMESKVNDYKAVILCSSNSINNVLNWLPIWNELLQPKAIVIISPQYVCKLVSDKQWTFKVECVDENTVFPFLNFENVKKKMYELAGNRPAIDRRIGWYFQQFLKMAYCVMCQEETYLIWDSDTIPTHYINMKKEDLVFLDVKTEYNSTYFVTMNRLCPDLYKTSKYSYISEHMLVKKDTMLEIISVIENNNEIDGKYFWEKILNAIDIGELEKSGFSEYELYGTYAVKHYANQYCIRQWSSLREGTMFFLGGGGINERILTKLSSMYDAISFENYLLHKRMALLFSHRLFANAEFILLYKNVRKLIERLKLLNKKETGEKN